MRNILAVLFFLCALFAIPALFTSGIWTDYREKAYFTPAPDIEYADGKCTRYNLVVTLCDIEYVDGGVKGERHYFTFGGWGDSSIDFLRSSRDPSIVTVATAVDNLTWRLVTVLTFALLGIAAIVKILLNKSAANEDEDHNEIDANVPRRQLNDMEPARQPPAPAQAPQRLSAPQVSSGAGARPTFGQRRY